MDDDHRTTDDRWFKTKSYYGTRWFVTANIHKIYKYPSPKKIFNQNECMQL